MSVVRECIVLRRRRREGDKMPHRIALDSLKKSDSLLVEIVIDRKADLVYRCLFGPAQLAGRKGVTFRESGQEIFWLSGLKPKPLLQQQAEAMLAESDAVKNLPVRGTVANKVLVFDEGGSMVAVYRMLQDVARAINLKEAAIDKLCRTKRMSTETGLSFRYWRKNMGTDMTDFSLTLSRYDDLCRRKPKGIGQEEEE